MYRLGQGVEESIEEAISHCRKGAEARDPFAHLSLAHCYTYGEGVEKNLEKAFAHNDIAKGAYRMSIVIL